VLNGSCAEECENKFKVQTAVGKVMASILCYSGGTLLVEFRATSADVKVVTITQSKCSATQQYQSVPIIISFVPPLVVIKTQLVVLHTADRTDCTL
jgi:hypothetical protein